MVVNRKDMQTTPGMTTGEMVVSEEGLTNDENSSNSVLEKRGRGRPSGSLNKANELSKLTAEVEALNSKVEALQAQINTQAPSIQLNTPVSSNQLEKRLEVIQSWVENFHQFLLTSRITNSADRAAEEELALIIQHLPDNVFVGNAER